MPLPELTLITAGDSKPNATFFTKIEHALLGGVGQIIVREKNMDSAHLLAFSSRLRSLTEQHHAKLIIHSQADIAKAVQADGVHLASSDIAEINSIRDWLNMPEVSLSASCHNLEELQQAQQCGADFAMLSPVFPTQSHPGCPALGVHTFQQLAAATALPIIALGGIDATNRAQLNDHPVATIRAILDAHDSKQSAQALLSASITLNCDDG